MNESTPHQYERIAKAIEFIQTHFTSQPSLEEIAEHVHLSPFHFQRLFQEWAGTTPKKFLQYISIQYAKSLLKQPSATLFDVAHQTGLSSTSRLHDLFIKLEAMSPGEYKRGGKSLTIAYQMESTPFGPILMATTHQGICYLGFHDSLEEGLAALQLRFPFAQIQPSQDKSPHPVVTFFQFPTGNLPQIKLHLKGTPFQLKVWEALLKIPMGARSTYGQLAHEIGQPTASRAVGTAIGSNPIAFIIPCHRVIQASGHLGGYMWGPIRKAALLGWENAAVANDALQNNDKK